jgi:hypothetical protein
MKAAVGRRLATTPDVPCATKPVMANTSKGDLGDHDVRVVTTIVTSMSDSIKASVEEVSRKLRATIQETTEAEEHAQQISWEEAKKVRPARACLTDVLTKQ